MHEDLNLHAYKIILMQELKIADHHSSRMLADWLIKNRKNDAEMSSKIIFSDEAHFTLNGCVNKQNCRIWAVENSRVIQKQALHSQKVTVGVHCGQKA